MSRKSDLALRAISYIDEHGGSVDGRSIAAAIGTTINFLPQVLKPLIGAGWMASTPGRGGGYRLAADLDSVSVLDVVEAIEGALEDGRCVLRAAPCPAQEECALHRSWVRARSALLTELGGTSLAAALTPAPTKGD